MAKKLQTPNVIVDEDTPLTTAIDEFLKVFNQITWNHTITSKEYKLCDELIKNVNDFAYHFGFRERDY